MIADGHLKKKIFWLYQNKKNEVIFGLGYGKFVNRSNQDFHWTIHDDGTQTERFYGDRKKFSKAFSKWDGKGIRRIFTFNIFPVIKEEIGVNYEPEKNDELLEIDVKECVENGYRLLIDIYQLEPKKENLIQNIHNGKPPDPKIHIFDTFVPWIVVCIYKITNPPISTKK